MLKALFICMWIDVTIGEGNNLRQITLKAIKPSFFQVVFCYGMLSLPNRHRDSLLKGSRSDYFSFRPRREGSPAWTECWNAAFDARKVYLNTTVHLSHKCGSDMEVRIALTRCSGRGLSSYFLSLQPCFLVSVAIKQARLDPGLEIRRYQSILRRRRLRC